MLDVGDVKGQLLGGYDMKPAWLHGRPSVGGTIERSIPGQNRPSAAVARLDEPMPTTGGAATIAILELRHVGATLDDEVVVHVELCDFEAEDRRFGLQAPRRCRVARHVPAQAVEQRSSCGQPGPRVFWVDVSPPHSSVRWSSPHGRVPLRCCRS
jgi:hypothetical protein